MRRFTGFAMVVLCVIGSGSARAADAPAVAAKTTHQALLLPGGRALMLTLPEGWGYSARSPRPGMPPTATFTGAGVDRRFSVQLSIVPLQPGKEAPTAEKLRELAKGQGEGMLATAKETKLEIIEVKGEGTIGYGFTLSDKAPAPGSFENMTSVFALTGDVILGATILHHGKAAAERKSALEMLRTAKLAPAEKGAAAGTLRAGPGTGAWTMRVPAAGVEVMQQSYEAARKVTQVMAANAETGLVVSVFMEPAQKAGDAAAVREVYWGKAQRSPMKKEGIKLGKSGEFTTVEYLIPESQGLKIDQKNLNVYAVKEGVWIDIHVSKTEFADKDQSQFDAVAGGVVFEGLAKGK